MVPAFMQNSLGSYNMQSRLIDIVYMCVFEGMLINE